ncbi:hypothetical protein [Sphingomicrobium aestuariivivum]|uniref:hypothetical protein n=1 Tax=Sphingomicrobium aestuariivivum TaxID=1582356 RepID=UPI001FD714DE|nr:hypothetical protein [Sphingomicrobium aestuariivivum]MCJ8191908.1 hypothetical protein [Sphingomicrobium aestuariivivum]
MAKADIVANVFVSNVHQDREGQWTGDFIYQQTYPKGPELFVRENGDIDLNSFDGPVNIRFDWASPFVTIEDKLYGCSYLTPSYKTFTFPDNAGGEIHANRADPSNDTMSITYTDDNDDGKTREYTLCVWANTNGDGTNGTRIYNDPKLINRTNN